MEQGENDLSTLLESMQPTLMPDTYVYTTLTAEDKPPKQLEDKSVFTFQEKEGKTFVLPMQIVETLGYQFEFPCRMITLKIHSSLAAVGFLAIILKRLAQEEIPCNVASGFFHDHLFIPVDREEDAMAVLESISDGFKADFKDQADGEEEFSDQNDAGEDFNEEEDGGGDFIDHDPEVGGFSDRKDFIDQDGGGKA